MEMRLFPQPEMPFQVADGAAEEGKHRIENGLLLRSDIHRLFDSGSVTITPDYKFHASRKLKDNFDNGEEYLRLQGSNIWLPRDSDSRPKREFLEWHSDTIFRG
jgi:putative restriction endonuclease